MTEVDAACLRALSIAPSLAFMLIAETQLLECVEKSGGRPCEVQVAKFPALAPTYQTLLKSCAARFGFRVAETFGGGAGGDNDDNTTNNKNHAASTATNSNTANASSSSSTDKSNTSSNLALIGAGRVPALRYADFLPGHLYVTDLLLAASSVVGTDLTAGNPAPTEDRFPSTRVVNARTYIVTFSPAVMKLASTDIPALISVAGGGGLMSQLATSVDLGLPLATFTHILRLECVGGVTSSDALEAFRRFSGWRSMDVRWEDEAKQRVGLLVFPAASDATDILDVYEDEDSDTDAHTAVLPFKLRPLASTVVVPSVDDSALRRSRSSGAWEATSERWRFLAASPVQLKIQIQGFGVTAKLRDVLVSAPFEIASFSRAVLLAEVTPLKRRRAVVTVTRPEAVRAALELDGHRASNLPGKPVLRVIVAPPCRDVEKRATLIEQLEEDELRSMSAPAAASPTTTAAPAVAAAAAPAAPTTANAAALLAPKPRSKSVSPPPEHENKEPPLLPPDSPTTPVVPGQGVMKPRLNAGAAPFTPTMGAASSPASASGSGVAPASAQAPQYHQQHHNNQHHHHGGVGGYHQQHFAGSRSPVHAATQPPPPPPPPPYTGGGNAPPPPPPPHYEGAAQQHQQHHYQHHGGGGYRGGYGGQQHHHHQQGQGYYYHQGRPQPKPPQS